MRFIRLIPLSVEYSSYEGYFLEARAPSEGYSEEVVEGAGDVEAVGFEGGAHAVGVAAGEPLGACAPGADAAGASEGAGEASELALDGEEAGIEALAEGGYGVEIGFGAGREGEGAGYDADGVEAAEACLDIEAKGEASPCPPVGRAGAAGVGEGVGGAEAVDVFGGGELDFAAGHGS